MTTIVRHALTAQARTLIIVCLIVLCGSFLGIASRPMGHLAALWPANALLLGVMVRFPRLSTIAGWMGALMGYLLAEIGTGDTVLAMALLTTANFACVVTGYFLLSRLHEDHRKLRRPLSVPYLAVISAISAAAAGVIGAIADPILFNGTPATGWIFWFVTELVNLVAILPVILTIPDLAKVILNKRKLNFERFNWRSTFPFLTLVLSFVMGIVIGGPGAVAFPVPALLWCALTYSLFSTTLLTLLASGWLLLSMSKGYFPISFADMNSRPMLLSIRLGVTLLALAPITVASVMAVREELLRRLEYLAGHDQLTGLLNRRAFSSCADDLLKHLSEAKHPVAALMFDLDKFKSVNDTYGHAAGDKVLVAFSHVAKEQLRAADKLGRMGGEEFVALLPNCDRDKAEAIAQRIRNSLENQAIDIGNGQHMSVTVSIGATAIRQASTDIDALLLAADKALYKAKESGRNRVEFVEINQT